MKTVKIGGIEFKDEGDGLFTTKPHKGLKISIYYWGKNFKTKQEIWQAMAEYYSRNSSYMETGAKGKTKSEAIRKLKNKLSSFSKAINTFPIK